MGYKFNPFTGNFDLIDTTAAAGADTQVQYNSNGSLAGSADLTWDDTAKELGVGGDINLDDGGTYATTLQLITPTANRTISFPDATGTVALVGGSSGQLVYNNAGAYAGAPSTSVGATGSITLSLAGAASTPPVSLTGTWFSGGTSTTTKPQLLIEPTGTTSTAWSTSGTGLGVNAASGFGGNLLDLQVNGTSRVVATSTGGVGIGTTPSYKFHIAGGNFNEAVIDGATNGGGWAVARNGTKGGGVYNTGLWAGDTTNGTSLTTAAGNELRFYIGTTPVSRFDSSGRLLVGTSSARTDFSAGTIVQVESVGSGAARYAATSNNNLSADGAGFYFARSRGTSVGSNAIVLDGDTLGGLFFQGADGTDIASRAGEIKCEVDGTPGANDMPGRLVFSTTADGASTTTERMRIKSNGTINFSNVSVYADNTAALAGGLVAGDVYRKSDGTLMITY